MMRTQTRASDTCWPIELNQVTHRKTLSPHKMSADSAQTYELHAQAYLQARDQSTIGVDVIQAWCNGLPKNSSVLELACGAGYPLTRVLLETGMRVWALDSSPSLLAEFTQRFPSVPVQCAKVQESDFFGLHFDAVIAVGLMFLLSEDDQVSLIHRVGKILQAGGRFLFSVPVQTCQWMDLTTGILSQSLGRQNYEEHLYASGMQLIATFIDEGGNHYFEAQLLAS